MNYSLPAGFALGATSASLAYTPIHERGAIAALEASFAAPAAWHAVLAAQAAPSAADLVRLCLEEHELHLWHVAPKAGGEALGTCLINTAAADWHVGVLHAGHFHARRNAEIVAHLASAIFGQVPGAREVDTRLTVPEPPGGPEALGELGFMAIESSVDRRTRQTFGLFRETWEAYRI